MRAFMHRLARDERGAVAVEFALWTILFFIVVMAALDFGMYYIQRGQVSEAVSAASVASFNNREDVKFDELPDYVRALAESPNLTVAITCNDGTCKKNGRTCACLKSDGTYASKTCGAACTGSGVTANSTAGYYMTVNASRPYVPMILPNGVLTDAVIEQKATVRLE